MNITWLREQAQRAERLARSSTDPNLSQQLRAAATEFTARADARESSENPQDEEAPPQLF